MRNLICQNSVFESDIYIKILQCHFKQTIYRTAESIKNYSINGINTFYFLAFIMYVFGGHLIFGTENFFQFWIVLRGKTSSQDNDEEQNEILLILSPRQYSKRRQNRIKQKLHSILQKPSYSLWHWYSNLSNWVKREQLLIVFLLFLNSIL